MNKINEIGDTPRGRGWLGAVQARANNRMDRARLNAEIPRSERERESKKQEDIMKRAVDTAYKNSNTSDALTFRQMRAGANDFYRKNNYSRVPVDYEDTMWDEWNESKKIGGNRINEIGDTSKGQEALGRTAERAYQRAQRTSGADKKRYEKTFNDAYRTGGKSANKHLGGSREHFDNGRDYEHEKWEKEHNGNVAESKNMNKKLIRLTESDLHKIVKESAKRIMKEVALKGKSGKTYSLHGTDPESWAVMSRVRGKNGYFPNTPQHYHACRDEDNWIELDDKAHPNLRSRNNANRINAMMNRIDDKSKDIMAANESKLSRIVKESVDKILSESDYWREAEDNYLMQEKLPRGWEKRKCDDVFGGYIYIDGDYNEFYKDEYGHLQPLDN